MKLTDLEVGDGIQLCLPRPELADELFALVDGNRAHLGAWLEWVPATQSPKDSQRFLFDASRYNEGGQRCTYLIAKDGQLAGSMAFVSIHAQHHHAELGYWIAQNHQGQGLITRAAQRFLHYAFLERPQPINRVIIRALSENQRSIAVAQRLGFQHEARLREVIFLNGQYYDAELFAMLKKDFLDHLPLRNEK